MGFVVAGTVEDFTADARVAMKQKFLDTLASPLITLSDITITVRAASVELIITINAPSEEVRDSNLATLQSETSDTASTSALLSTPLRVIAVERINQAPVATASVAPSTDDKCQWVEGGVDYCPLENSYSGSCGGFEKKTGCWKDGMCCAKSSGDCCEDDEAALAWTIVGGVIGGLLLIACCVLACCMQKATAKQKETATGDVTMHRA